MGALMADHPDLTAKPDYSGSSHFSVSHLFMAVIEKTGTVYLEASINKKGKTMISIKSLSKTYKSNGHVVNALNHLDLEIGGGMFGLLGPNGAGKTTLMRILAGIVNASNGSVKINGNDLATDNGKTAVQIHPGLPPTGIGDVS
jgi:ABC-type glutathione transport system ATPase component